MFKKLITGLKQKIPEALRKKLGIEGEHVQEEEQLEENSGQTSEEPSEQPSEQSVEEGSGELKEDGGETSDSEISASDKKKKQITMIVRVALALVLGFLVLDHFFLSNNSSNEVVNVPIRPRRKKLIPPPPPTAPVAVPITEQPKQETTPGVEQNVTPAPVENVNITNEKSSETAPLKTKETEDKVDKEVSKTPEEKSGEQVEKSIDSLIDQIDGKEQPGQAETAKNEKKLEDKIVAENVEVPAPLYDQLGRGLVYNCKEKHWACVDKDSYIGCNKNMKWNKSQGKPNECVTINVYATDDDCSIVQKYNVSTGVSTAFCE